MSAPVVCIGGALVDELLYAATPLVMHTTNLGIVTRKSAGGVSRNIAHQLALMGLPVELIGRLRSITHYSGIPIDARFVTDQVVAAEKEGERN